MSVSLSQVLSASGYDLNTREDANWLLGIRNEFAELVELAEAKLDECEHLNTHTEQIEDTADYEYRQAQGETSAPLTTTTITVCDDCEETIDNDN